MDRNKQQYPEALTPLVPDNVVGLRDDTVLAVHEAWRTLDLDTVKSRMPEAQTVNFTNRLGRPDRYIKIALLSPPEADYDETKALVIALPFQQVWKPSMYIRSELTRQIVAPQARAVVFPNNSGLEPSYPFIERELKTFRSGDIMPLAELQTRALEHLKIGSVAVTGYSMGGLTALALGAHGSDKFEVTHINADEAPSQPRTAKQLRKDFLSSSSWGDQRAAIRDARLPVLSQALNRPRLALDYLWFGQSSLRRDSRALNQAMAAGIDNLVDKAHQQYPEAAIKLGRVAGSKVVGVETEPCATMADTLVRSVIYTGTATHRHATADNVVAHALMVKDSIRDF